MYEKFKSFLANDAFFTASLLILVGIISFGLGRQSVQGNGFTQSAAIQAATSPSAKVSEGVVFTDVSAVTTSVRSSSSPAQSPTTGQVVGSKTGSKYHLPTCPGAKQIKEGNKVYFDSPAFAMAAGYTPAANCPGLE